MMRTHTPHTLRDTALRHYAPPLFEVEDGEVAQLRVAVPPAEDEHVPPVHEGGAVRAALHGGVALGRDAGPLHGDCGGGERKGEWGERGSEEATAFPASRSRAGRGESLLRLGAGRTGPVAPGDPRRAGAAAIEGAPLPRGARPESTAPEFVARGRKGASPGPDPLARAAPPPRRRRPAPRRRAGGGSWSSSTPARVLDSRVSSEWTSFMRLLESLPPNMTRFVPMAFREWHSRAVGAFASPLMSNWYHAMAAGRGDREACAREAREGGEGEAPKNVKGSSPTCFCVCWGAAHAAAGCALSGVTNAPAHGAGRDGVWGGGARRRELSGNVGEEKKAQGGDTELEAPAVLSPALHPTPLSHCGLRAHGVLSKLGLLAGPEALGWGEGVALLPAAPPPLGAQGEAGAGPRAEGACVERSPRDHSQGHQGVDASASTSGLGPARVCV
jgi:hypothetical protein